MSAERVQPEAEKSLGTFRISRRDFLKISGAGLVGASLLGVAGCGGGGGGQQGSGGGGAQGNSIVTGIDQEPAVLNRMLSEGQLAVTNDTTAGIVEPVIAIQPDLSYKPVLAEAIPELVSEDPMILEYKLREGLTWSDGEPLTSADAKWTFDQIMNPDNNIVSREGWQDISKFETPDERTVRMTFETPYAPWTDLMGDNWPIHPKHVYEGKDFNTALNNEIVGSGPFKFKEWKKGESLTVERNENYWGEKAGLDSVTYRFITDTNTLITSLQAGEVQFIHPPPDLGLQDKLEGVEGTKMQIGKGGVIWEAIHFQLENIPNLKMRQAIAYGINREQILNQMLKGVVDPLQSVLMPQQGQFYTPADVSRILAKLGATTRAAAAAHAVRLGLA